MDSKFLYRGQSQFYEPCVPGLYRNKYAEKHYQVLRGIYTFEMMVALRQHPLVKLLEGGVEMFHDTFVFEMNYDGLSQHYYNQTKYLDLTSNLDVATFFCRYHL